MSSIEPGASNHQKKEQILSHMNADHQDSAIRFLEYYCHLSSYAARNAQFVDIDLSTIAIACGRNVHHVAFKPPMQSLKEARERLVSLDRAAIDARGRSSITVKAYRGPSTIFEVTLFAACILTLTILWRKQNVTPGSWLYDTVFKLKPAYAHALLKMQRISWLILCIHLAEAAYMATMKLSKHTVPVGSLLWWKWVLSTFIDGLFSFRRFNKLVRETAQVKARRSH